MDTPNRNIRHDDVRQALLALSEEELFHYDIGVVSSGNTGEAFIEHDKRSALSRWDGKVLILTPRGTVTPLLAAIALDAFESPAPGERFLVISKEHLAYFMGKTEVTPSYDFYDDTDSSIFKAMEIYPGNKRTYVSMSQWEWLSFNQEVSHAVNNVISFTRFGMELSRRINRGTFCTFPDRILEFFRLGGTPLLTGTTSYVRNLWTLCKAIGQASGFTPLPEIDEQLLSWNWKEKWLMDVVLDDAIIPDNTAVDDIFDQYLHLFSVWDAESQYEGVRLPISFEEVANDGIMMQKIHQYKKCLPGLDPSLDAWRHGVPIRDIAA